MQSGVLGGVLFCNQPKVVVIERIEEMSVCAAGEGLKQGAGTPPVVSQCLRSVAYQVWLSRMTNTDPCA